MFPVQTQLIQPSFRNIKENEKNAHPTKNRPLAPRTIAAGFRAILYKGFMRSHRILYPLYAGIYELR